MAHHVRAGRQPLIDEGAAVWSFAHIEDTAIATVDALTAAPGVYNVVDDDPAPVSQWLPAFAKFIGADPPLRISEQQARQQVGDDAVYYYNQLTGASNAKAKREWHFAPRRLAWLGM